MRVLTCQAVWFWVEEDALETRTRLWFGDGCSGHRIILKHEGLWSGHGCSGSSDALGTRTRLRFGHGCCGKPYTQGVDVVMVAAWMLSEKCHAWWPEGASNKVIRQAICMG